MDTDFARRTLTDLGVRDVRVFDSAKAAVQAAADIEDTSRSAIAGALDSVRRRKSPAATLGYYPVIALPAPSDISAVPPGASSGFFPVADRLYMNNVSRVGQRLSYFVANVDTIMRTHNVRPLVGLGTTPIPVEYCAELDGSESAAGITRFSRFSYKAIMEGSVPPKGLYHLSPYDALLQDYFWECLRHYTGTDPQHFQRFIVLFNYRKYEAVLREICPHIVRRKFRQLPECNKGEYSEFILPDGFDTCGGNGDTEWQMPAYHLKRPDGLGISFVNVGVGAPSAVTLAEAVCSLRPDLVLMAGHCGGVAQQHQIGNFIVGSDFVSFCGATARDVPPEMNFVAPGEVVQSNCEALRQVYELTQSQYKDRVERGTMASLDYRHWVVRATWYSLIAKARAHGVDMESAEVARLCKVARTPFGFLGMITDIPPFNKPKLRGPARRLYEQTRTKFLLAALRSCEILREHMLAGTRDPHSRRLVPKFFPPGEIDSGAEIPYPFA